MQRAPHAINGLKESVEQSILIFCEFLSGLKKEFFGSGYQDLMCGLTWRPLWRYSFRNIIKFSYITSSNYISWLSSIDVWPYLETFVEAFFL